MRKVWQSDTHFCVLYRIFLRRVVDLDLLSTDADTSKLLGQSAALFAGASFLFTAPLVLFGGGLDPFSLWTMEHLLIATSMLVVGLLSILAWESIFPERLDLLIMGPQPVRVRTVFVAKLAALIGTLALSMLALNCFTGLIWPLLFSPAFSGLAGNLRSFVAYWGVILAAGLFTVFSVIGFQGVLSQFLPRQLFLRFAVWIQACAFCLLLAVYILEPSLEAPEALMAPANQRLLGMLPSYWFFGLFQQLNGSMEQGSSPLARRAWLALAFAASTACLSIFLGYLRSIRRIVEQPDIIPRKGGIWQILQLGTGSAAAVLLFSAMTLLRSRKHRVLLAFYWGAGAAIVYAIANTRSSDLNATDLRLSRIPTETYLLASLLLIGLSVGALRTLLVLPITARAEWIFRITEFEKVSIYRGATRQFLEAFAICPIWCFLTAVALWRWPSWTTIIYALDLGLIGILLIHLCSFRLRKIPFACSYLPGQGNVHLVFWCGTLLLLPITEFVAKCFYRSLETPARCLVTTTLLGGLLAGLKWKLKGPSSDEAGLLFEQAPTEDLQSLGL
jgi:hypothetical protein